MAVCPPKHVDVIADTSLDGGSIPPTSTYDLAMGVNGFDRL